MAANYQDFQAHFQILAKKRPELIVNTLSNIFTMRLVGNKTHGDMAEIGLTEFIHQFMYNYDCLHVGKERYRAKGHEEDIVITDELTNTSFPVSIKAYGDGPLQLSTDKEAKMFPELEQRGEDISDLEGIAKIFSSDAFTGLSQINVLPLIYKEKQLECNIMVFDFEKMVRDTSRILYVPKHFQYNAETHALSGRSTRKHPIYLFLDEHGRYICEVRYGGPEANALQRGLWTHTQHAYSYFKSLTNGWISYEHNDALVKLFRLALNATAQGHHAANTILQEDIDRFFSTSH